MRSAVTTFAVCVVGLVLRVEPVAAAESPPNIVLILVDDLGWADLGCYGADLHETPNIDRLAQQGMRFTQAYAASPVCTPTRASIMTGKHPARLHMTIWREASKRPVPNRPLRPPLTRADLPLEETTLAEVFHQAGYFTAHIGKWHLGGPNHYPEVHGFEVNVGGTLWGAPATFYFPYRGDHRFGGEFRYVPGLPPGKPGDYLTDKLTDAALTMIEAARGRPFFLNLWYHTVHTPIEGKSGDAERFEKRIHDGLRHRNAHYAAMVSSLDENVGRLLARLDELGLANETVVFLLSDNGGFINESDGQVVTDNHPLRSGKGSLYEGGIRIPFIARWPGRIPPRTASDELVITSDVYPTLLSLAGLPTPMEEARSVDGRDVSPVLHDPSQSLERETLFFHYPHYYPTTSPVSAMRHGSWKLLEYFEGERIELYNLAEDLGEAHNLAGVQPRKAAELRNLLQEWRDAVKAQLPVPNPDYEAGRRH